MPSFGISNLSAFLYNDLILVLRDANKSHLLALFDPVVVGECGFRGGSDRTYKFEGVSYMLKKYGLAGCIWDNHGTQGTTDNYEIFDREQCAPYNKNYTDGVMRGLYTDSDDSQLN